MQGSVSHGVNCAAKRRVGLSKRGADAGPAKDIKPDAVQQIAAAYILYNVVVDMQTKNTFRAYLRIAPQKYKHSV